MPYPVLAPLFVDGPSYDKNREFKGPIPRSMMLTTEAMITEIPEEKKAPAGAPGMGGMDEF